MNQDQKRYVKEQLNKLRPSWHRAPKKGKENREPEVVRKARAEIARFEKEQDALYKAESAKLMAAFAKLERKVLFAAFPEDALNALEEYEKAHPKTAD